MFEMYIRGYSVVSKQMAMCQIEIEIEISGSPPSPSRMKPLIPWTLRVTSESEFSFLLPY